MLIKQAQISVSYWKHFINTTTLYIVVVQRCNLKHFVLVFLFTLLIIQHKNPHWKRQDLPSQGLNKPTEDWTELPATYLLPFTCHVIGPESCLPLLLPFDSWFQMDQKFPSKPWIANINKKQTLLSRSNEVLPRVQCHRDWETTPRS